MSSIKASLSKPNVARPVAVELFAGAGGMSLGFEQAGFDVLASVDNDPVHLAVHERNFPFSHPLCADISTLTPEAIHAAVRKGWALTARDGEWDGTIDCLFGGPSCQGFSDMGRQAADDERNHLVIEFARLVEELMPRSFVIENVPGLLFPKFGSHLASLQQRLRKAGYTLQAEQPRCYDAADYGVPQRRRRVFIIGVVEGVSVPEPPKLRPGPTVAEALDDLPNVEDFEELRRSDQLTLTYELEVSLQTGASSYVKSLRTPTGLEYRRKWNCDVLTGCQRTDHSEAVRSRFAKLAPGEEDDASRTSRLMATGRSQTLRAGTSRDHGSFTAPRPIHHRQPRVVTVRESARLHSFPDWFAFSVAKWHALRQIGNSVPPRLAAAVAKTVVTSLGPELRPPTTTYEVGPDPLLKFSLHRAAEHFGIDCSALPPDVRRRAKALS